MGRVAMSVSSTLQTVSISSAMIRGITAIKVEVEVGISPGIPGMSIVGMPDTAVLEARARVRCALRSAGFSIPRMNIMVNLSPAEIRKVGTAFDLPIAVGILRATNQLDDASYYDCLFVGELALDGSVCPVRGQVAYIEYALEHGLTLVGAGFSAYEGVDIRNINSLSDLRKGLESLALAASAELPTSYVNVPDFADVYDQELAKRACVISAAGEHGLLMLGPAGVGKTLIAKCMPSILPDLDDAEMRESLLIRSVAGEEISSVAARKRPVRMPHHSITSAGLLGGGQPVRPGEISLAHNGVLFLDELAEFSNAVLQGLRQPLEEGCVRLVRADGAYSFPARFLLLAAANPCPCGNLGDPTHRCICSAQLLARYQAKLRGPLIDRIDLQVHLSRPDPSRLLNGRRGASSAELMQSVLAGRVFAKRRMGKGIIGEEAILRSFSSSAKTLLECSARQHGLGGRATFRVARVARTIADIDSREQVIEDDVSEALFYRVGVAS